MSGESTTFSSAELLTKQFYDWELRGRGWQMHERPVALEPPFTPFAGHFLPRATFVDDGQRDTFGSRLARTVKGWLGQNETIGSPQLAEPEDPEPEFVEPTPELIELQLSLPPEYQPPANVFEHCLSSLSYCRSPLAFEVVGTKESLVAQIVATQEDGNQTWPQLKAHFPQAVIEPVSDYLVAQWHGSGSEIPPVILDFGLDREFMVPLNPLKQLAIDPLVSVCGAMERLNDDELGLFQILFQPVRHRWGESMLRAVTTSDGDSFFENDKELLAHTRHKLAKPLYAVVVRVAAKASGEARQWEIIKGLSGALKPFGGPQTNELVALHNEDYPDEDHEADVLSRTSCRSGMLLNSDELVALAHLPTAAIRSRKLKREIKRTKEAPQIVRQHGIQLGANLHEGTAIPVALQTEQRLRHVHLVGGSGTGKSTLLLNLVCQDIYQGNGVAVLDPHGDLIDSIMGYIPLERFKDVVLFDPSDDEYPIGFNLLTAHSDLERTLLASDLVAVCRRLATSWGDQMNSQLGNAILAFLESTRGGTMPELRRFLVDDEFRKEFLPTVQDEEVRYFWEHEYAYTNKASLGSILTRLDTFLRPKTVRYMVGQRENKIDFGAVMSEGKILLAKLSQGLIGEENSYLLGSLLVAKFQQLAIARQQQQAADRRPFFLYLDEFHHFITPSLGTILTGARKYGLGLTLAHQSLKQLQRNEEVASDVLANTYSRVCFRVSDDDARKLSEGFGYFEATDLQNLANFEAICRVEKKEWDFNLKTAKPPELDPDTPKRREYLRYLSRVQYGTPRQKVEEELARSRFQPKRAKVDPFAKRTAKPAPDVSPAEPVEAEAPAPPVPEQPSPVAKPATAKVPKVEPAKVEVPPEDGKPVTPLRPPGLPPEQGRGGAEHRYHQQLIKQTAEGLGWRADIEYELPGGGVDVLLSRGLTTVACEISRTNKPDYEVGSIRKRLNAGVTWVCLLSSERKHLKQIQALAQAELTAAEQAKVHFLDPGDLPEILGKLADGQPTAERTVKGRRVRTTYKQMTGTEGESIKDSVSQALRQAWQRFKK